MALLIREIDLRFSRQLPRVVIGPRKISRPLRPAAKAEEHGYVKAGSMFFLSEKTTSQFEWNPGIYLHLGDEKDDNVIGMGLYGPSSRQIKRLRAAFTRDHATLDELLAARAFRRHWGAMAEEKYVRFPKDYSPDGPGASYLWYKQFYVRRQFTRKEVTSKGFPELVLRSFEAGLPLFSWIRESVGVFDRRVYEQERRDRLEAELHP